MPKPALHGKLLKVTLNLYAEDVELARALFPRNSLGGWSLIFREVLHAFMNSKRKAFNIQLGDVETNARISDPSLPGESPEDSR